MRTKIPEIVGKMCNGGNITYVKPNLKKENKMKKSKRIKSLKQVLKLKEFENNELKKVLEIKHNVINSLNKRVKNQCNSLASMQSVINEQIHNINNLQHEHAELHETTTKLSNKFNNLIKVMDENIDEHDVLVKDYRSAVSFISSITRDMVIN